MSAGIKHLHRAIDLLHPHLHRPQPSQDVVSLALRLSGMGMAEYHCQGTGIKSDVLVRLTLIRLSWSMLNSIVPWQVRRVYARHVGASDISGFMSELGYSGFDQLSGPASTAFRLAFSITNPDRCMQQPLAQRALAEAAYKQLQEWSAQLDSGRSGWAMG